MIDSSTTWDKRNALRPPGDGLAAAIAALARKGLRQLQRTPLLPWSLIVAAALLAFFVHLLNAQVLRGEKLREDQRAAATRPLSRLTLAAGIEHPANALIAGRHPLARP